MAYEAVFLVVNTLVSDTVRALKFTRGVLPSETSDISIISATIFRAKCPCSLYRPLALHGVRFSAFAIAFPIARAIGSGFADAAACYTLPLPILLFSSYMFVSAIVLSRACQSGNASRSGTLKWGLYKTARVMLQLTAVLFTLFVAASRWNSFA